MMKKTPSFVNASNANNNLVNNKKIEKEFGNCTNFELVKDVLSSVKRKIPNN